MYDREEVEDPRAGHMEWQHLGLCHVSTRQRCLKCSSRHASLRACLHGSFGTRANHEVDNGGSCTNNLEMRACQKARWCSSTPRGTESGEILSSTLLFVGRSHLHPAAGNTRLGCRSLAELEGLAELIGLVPQADIPNVIAQSTTCLAHDSL
jgi:hypothetical protein